MTGANQGIGYATVRRICKEYPEWIVYGTCKFTLASEHILFDLADVWVMDFSPLPSKIHYNIYSDTSNAWWTLVFYCNATRPQSGCTVSKLKIQQLHYIEFKSKYSSNFSVTKMLLKWNIISIVLQSNNFFSWIGLMVATENPECESSRILLCM